MESCYARAMPLLLLFFCLYSAFSNLISSCTATPTPTLMCSKSERKALLTFKQGLDDISNRLSSWSGQDCCSWKGVGCYNTTRLVVSLNVSRYDLSGKISDSLLHLKHLRYLDLSSNDFGGHHIPKFLGSLTNLRYLNLFDSSFTGMIPHQLGNLSNLYYLNLGSSLSSGQDLLSKNLDWVSRLSSLEFLQMDEVSLYYASNWLQVINMLPSLKELYLRNCALDRLDPLPRVNFSSLVMLDLSWNYFQSPKVDWLSSLHSLVALDLSFNDFYTPIHSSLQNISTLRYLDLSSNKFNSTIPDWLYKLTSLESIQASSNKLQGTISNDVGNLTSLNVLQLSGNGFEGGIPISLRNLCSLRTLDLSFNKLAEGVYGLLESSSACLLESLESLNLANNQFEGNLSIHLGHFQHLSVLSIANNSFSGPIPMSFGKLLSLRELRLSHNQFSGKLPESLGQLMNLEHLDIADNFLQGVVSEVHFANLVRLKTLEASSNLLALQVASNWTPPFQLEIIKMRLWQLGPSFPSWVRTQKECWYLDLSDTGISQAIPTWFWSSSQIQHLNLSHNHIPGNIPNLPFGSAIYLGSNNFSGPLPRITSDVMDLDLSNNSFTGHVDPIACNDLMFSRFLDLSENHLSGELPDCWMKWPFLMVLRLGNNHLRGKIPSSIGSLLDLRSLHLRSNGLVGQLPSSLKKCKKLKIVDLSENEFVGRIPIWIGKRLPRLIVLALRSNRFNGSIPRQLCRLNVLQILDLADNNLTGNIPQCLGDFGAMSKQVNSSGRISYDVYGYEVSERASLVTKGVEYEYSNTLALVTSIDLSRNRLSGKMPWGLTSLYGLLYLNLSSNHLQGAIPERIGVMKSLESLDLSVNQFSGAIPQTMVNLTFLSHLNLSLNNFSGKIPLGTQLQSFSALSFIGNKNLCGPPLTDKCPGDDVTGDGEEGSEPNDDGWIDMKWFYMTIPFGFVVGFWGILSPLALNKRWRYAYFQFFDCIADKLF